MTATIEQQVAQVLEFAESAPAEFRYVEDMKVGEWVRQGDVYLVRIEKSEDWRSTEDRQIALGNTQGSRHTVADSVTVLRNPNCGRVDRLGEDKFQCLGNQVVSETRFRVDHPEHAHISLPPGCYQVQFQVDGRSQSYVRD